MVFIVKIAGTYILMKKEYKRGCNQQKDPTQFKNKYINPLIILSYILLRIKIII